MQADLLKTYYAFIQAPAIINGVVPDTDVPNSAISNHDSFTKQPPTKPIDPKIKNDFYLVKDTFERIKSNIDEADNKAYRNKELTHAVFAALSPIVPVRRISSVPDNVDDGNYLRAAGIIGLAVANLPEDWRDIKSAGRQIFKGIKPDYDYKNYQHSFSFFRGTFLEPLLKLKGKYSEKISYFLSKSDISLDTTKFGKILSKIFKFKIDYDNPEFIKRTEKSGKTIFLQAFTVNGNFMGKLMGRALLRTTLLGAISLGALEMPKIIKTFTDKKNENKRLKAGIKQIIKSGVYVTSMLSGIGIFGALLAGFGPAGSLIGMGIGSAIAVKISKIINNKIDNFC